MRLTNLSGLNCSIARTLDVVGEWWTLLIVRDALRGATRFDEFRDSLGMARGVLSSRLHKLVDQGILSRRQYSEHPPRHEYTLTEKGRALAPVITALMTWGDTWAPGPSGPPVVLIHEPCGHPMHPILTCPHCHGDVKTGDVRQVPGPGAASKENNTPARTRPSRDRSLRPASPALPGQTSKGNPAASACIACVEPVPCKSLFLVPSWQCVSRRSPLAAHRTSGRSKD